MGRRLSPRYDGHIVRMKDEGGRMKERQMHYFHPSSFILHPCFLSIPVNSSLPPCIIMGKNKEGEGCWLEVGRVRPSRIRWSERTSVRVSLGLRRMSCRRRSASVGSDWKPRSYRAHARSTSWSAPPIAPTAKCYRELCAPSKPR